MALGIDLDAETTSGKFSVVLVVVVGGRTLLPPPPQAHSFLLQLSGHGCIADFEPISISFHARWTQNCQSIGVKGKLV